MSDPMNVVSKLNWYSRNQPASSTQNQEAGLSASVDSVQLGSSPRLAGGGGHPGPEPPHPEPPHPEPPHPEPPHPEPPHPEPPHPEPPHPEPPHPGPDPHPPHPGPDPHPPHPGPDPHPPHPPEPWPPGPFPPGGWAPVTVDANPYQDGQGNLIGVTSINIFQENDPGN